jgi:signal transduction histidine kinase
MADLDGAITALRYGAADYILKPINPDALRASLSRIVERLRTRYALEESQRKLAAERNRALQNERLAAIGETMTALIHESRNALQRSKACLEMLTLEVQDRPKAIDLVVRVQRAQDDMQQLYEEVRQYAAPINLRRDPCNLGELWREAWHNLSHLHEDKQLQLREEIGDLDLTTEADGFAIGQVWRNILENAIAAAPRSSTITIRAASTDLNGRLAWSVSFIDEGCGLTGEQRDRIFTPFYTTKAKGTGLGMAIVQRIVHSHQGQISASNAETGGATIEVVLPKVQL